MSTESGPLSYMRLRSLAQLMDEWRKQCECPQRDTSTISATSNASASQHNALVEAVLGAT